MSSAFAELDRNPDDANELAIRTLAHLMDALAFLLVQILPQAEITALDIMDSHLNILHDG